MLTGLSGHETQNMPHSRSLRLDPRMRLHQKPHRSCHTISTTLSYLMNFPTRKGPTSSSLGYGKHYRSNGAVPNGRSLEGTMLQVTKGAHPITAQTCRTRKPSIIQMVWEIAVRDLRRRLATCTAQGVYQTKVSTPTIGVRARANDRSPRTTVGQSLIPRNILRNQPGIGIIRSTDAQNMASVARCKGVWNNCKYRTELLCALRVIPPLR